MRWSSAFLVAVGVAGAVGACSSSAQQGLGPIRVEGKYTLNTTQACTGAARLQAQVDLALPLVVQELSRSGLVPSREQLVRLLREKPVLGCMVEQPEPCGWTPSRCAGTHRVECARKRGCASPWHFWVSRLWPPVCTAAWPDEPHCVASTQSAIGFVGDLVHELAEVVCLRLGTCRAHEEPALSAQRRTVEAYTAAGGPQ